MAATPADEQHEHGDQQPAGERHQCGGHGWPIHSGPVWRYRTATSDGMGWTRKVVFASVGGGGERRQAARAGRYTLPDQPQPAVPRMSHLPASEEVADASRALAPGATVPELHGALCGWLAGGGEDTVALAGTGACRRQRARARACAARWTACARCRSASSAMASSRLNCCLAGTTCRCASAPRRCSTGAAVSSAVSAQAAGAQPPLSEEGAEALQDLAQPGRRQRAGNRRGRRRGRGRPLRTRGVRPRRRAAAAWRLRARSAPSPQPELTCCVRSPGSPRPSSRAAAAS